MAIKINELVSQIKAGARTNKYRVIMPFFARDFDIQCHEVTSAGRSIGIAEVFLRGRKFQLAGDRAEAGSIQVSFYNDPNLEIRNFFLRYIEAIQSFATPPTVSESAVLASGTQLDLYTRIQNVLNVTKGYISEIKHNLDSFLSIAGFNFFGQGAWYQVDMTIQQLDANGDVVSQTIFHEAFITEVSEIAYTDETGEVSSTTLTIAYTGTSII